MQSFKTYYLRESIWYHGSPSGELKGSASGIHIGTKKAATEALTARIGHPVEGEWDGTREYGKTKLSGQNTLKNRGIFPTGHNCHAPNHDYYPHEHPKGMPKFSDGSKVSETHKPSIKAYSITGKMSNHPHNGMDDSKANGIMSGMIKRNKARKGYYYNNVGEDAGSVSAVVPSKDHLKEI